MPTPTPAPIPVALTDVVNPVFAADLIRPAFASQESATRVAGLIRDGAVVDGTSAGDFSQLLARSNPSSSSLASTAGQPIQNNFAVDPSRYLMADGQSTFFKDFQLAQMSRLELASVLEARKTYKKSLFADAIKLLESDVAIADVKSCEFAKETLEGLCAIMPAQRGTLRAQASAQLAGESSSDVPVPGITRKRALVIGLDKYTDKRIPQLVSAVYDARSIGEAFSGQLGYDVTLLQNPTKAEIVQRFNQSVVELNVTDSFVVYFAGHGELVEKTQMGYWIPGDASASDPSTWISNTDISRWLANINSKQLAVIADSCYSGTLALDIQADSSVLASTVADDYLRKRTITVMSSGSDEPVADTGKFGHSVFAWNLLEEIKALKSWTVGSSVFANVKTQVERELPQTPKYGVSTSAGHEDGGDFLFERRSKKKEIPSLNTKNHFQTFQ